MAINQPLDFEYWLVNVFAGGITIFFYLAVACIFWMGARFRMPLAAIFGLFFIFVLMMAQPGLITTGLARGILLLLIIVAGLILTAILAREQK